MKIVGSFLISMSIVASTLICFGQQADRQRADRKIYEVYVDIRKYSYDKWKSGQFLLLYEYDQDKEILHRVDTFTCEIIRKDKLVYSYCNIGASISAQIDSMIEPGDRVIYHSLKVKNVRVSPSLSYYFVAPFRK
jgi:hypothetical protein